MAQVSGSGLVEFSNITIQESVDEEQARSTEFAGGYVRCRLKNISSETLTLTVTYTGNAAGNSRDCWRYGLVSGNAYLSKKNAQVTPRGYDTDLRAPRIFIYGFEPDAVVNLAVESEHYDDDITSLQVNYRGACIAEISAGSNSATYHDVTIEEKAATLDRVTDLINYGLIASRLPNQLKVLSSAEFAVYKKAIFDWSNNLEGSKMLELTDAYYVKSGTSENKYVVLKNISGISLPLSFTCTGDVPFDLVVRKYSSGTAHETGATNGKNYLIISETYTKSSHKESSYYSSASATGLGSRTINLTLPTDYYLTLWGKEDTLPGSFYIKASGLDASIGSISFYYADSSYNISSRYLFSSQTAYLDTSNFNNIVLSGYQVMSLIQEKLV